MLVNEASGVFIAGAVLPKIVLSISGLLFLALLVYILLFPLFSKKQDATSIGMHPDLNMINNLTIPEFKNVAIALDFTENDQKLIEFAIGQGKDNTHFMLVHVVESASAKLLGADSDDYETRQDQERMAWYVTQLKVRGLNAAGHLGFRNRAKEIVRIVNEFDADMLVVGAHGHTGLKDFIYGETVNTVRHELKIPVLIVNI
jgi:manganese transport protein